MNLLLVTSTREELLALFPKKHQPQQTEEQKPFPASPAVTGKNSIFCCITGVGPINAALSIGTTLATLQLQGHAPDHLLLAGIAGAFDLERTPLCSLCLVKEEIWPEYGLHDGHLVIAKAFKWPLWQDAPNGPIYDRISLGCELIPAKKESTFTSCTSLSVAGVSASFQRAHDLWDLYHAELENMEGFAVAYGCLRLDVPMTEIRSVSNKVGPRKADEKDFPGALLALEELLPTLNLI